MIKILNRQLPEFKRTDHILKTYNYDDINSFQEDVLKTLDSQKNIILIGQVQSGKTRNVIEICQKALQKYSYDLVIVFSGNTNDLNQQTYERFEKEHYNVVASNSLDKVNKLTSLIIVALKQVDNIKNIQNFIINHQDKFKKTLVIDDECDFCGINTAKDAYEYTRVYEGIYADIVNSCSETKVIKLTATPFANILSTKNHLEKKPKIFVLPTNDDYTGINFFNKLNDFIFIRDGNDNKNHLILESLSIWIISTFMMHQNKNIANNDKSDLLININYKNHEQNVIKEIVNRYIWERTFDIKKNIKKIIETESKFHEINYDDVLLFFENQMRSQINCIVYNQTYNNKTNLNNYNIYVGGSFLSRGKTFDNLLCELIIINNEFNYDTLLQKCRWFGYRKSRSSYMAVICNKEVKTQLVLAEKIINFLHADYKGYELNYDRVLMEFKQKEDEFEKAKFTASGKR